LRRFVEDQTAEKRYEDVVRWLQFGRLVDVQRDLRALRQSTNAAAKHQAALKRVDTQLARRSESTVNAWDEAAVLDYSNRILAPLDNALLLNRFIAARRKASASE